MGTQRGRDREREVRRTEWKRGKLGGQLRSVWIGARLGELDGWMDG